MFVDYQKVRNAVVGTGAAIAAGAAAMFGFGGNEPDQPTPRPLAAVHQPVPTTQPVIKEQPKTVEQPALAPTVQPTPTVKLAPTPSVRPVKKPVIVEAKTDLQRYAEAMKLALGKADKSGKAKDILGPTSRWKLNLYDDDLDGQYDRGKLDKNRDDIDDEKWTFKKGRWEKDGGRAIWLEGIWLIDLNESTSQTASQSKTSSKPPVSPDLKRYRAAMQIATAKSDRSGKGKDVLGPRSPWKLNLYDDDKDGQWDRAKLDTNRDEKDDEKWNYKKGRWEKDGGQAIWNGTDWQTQ